MVNVKKGSELFLFEKALDNTKVGLIITDPSLPDHPIIYVNKGFLDLTGYEKEEVSGKNCRFLQGPETDEDSVQLIREAISKHEPITIELYNYRKDGSGFWNELSIEPLWVEEENKLYFTGVQKNISSEREKEKLLIESMKEIRQLSAPIVPLRKEVSILPIIGVLDSDRYENIITTVLSYISDSQTEYLIVDLSAIYEVDTFVASSLYKMDKSISLLGTKLILTGIKSTVAFKLIELGITFGDLKTFKTVQDALENIIQQDYS